MQDTPQNKAPRLVRKQILITAEQESLLKERARLSGLGQAALIRAAIDRELGVETTDDDWKSRLLTLAGALGDCDGLELRIAENRDRWRHRIDATSRKLNRED